MSKIKSLTKLKDIFYGATYKGVYENKKCIIKEIHIHENIDKPEQIISTYFDKFAKDHQDHFLILLSAKIIDNFKCNHKKPKNLIKSYVNEWNDAHKSKKIFQTIYYPLVENSLNDFRELYFKKKFKQNMKLECYSFLLQTFYCFYLLEKNNWIHCDAYPDTMYFINTKEKYNEIKIEKQNYKIQTYGKLWYMTEYNLVFYKDFDKKTLNKDSTIYFNLTNLHHFEASMISYILYQPLWDKIRQSGHNIPNGDYLYELLNKNKKIQYLKKFLPKYKEPVTIQKCLMLLITMFEPEEIIFCLNLNMLDFEEEIEIMKTKQIFTKDEILFLVKNLGNYEIIFKKIAPLLE